MVNQTENETPVVVQTHKYSFKIPPNGVRVSIDPNHKDISIIHAYPLIADFPSGSIPDDVNPRSHDRLPSRLAQVIEDSLIEAPDEFHLRNRGITILADRATYDERTNILEFRCPNPASYGVVDGATTDRTLARV